MPSQPEQRTAWRVKVPGFPTFVMAGEPCTRDEALQAARLIWPDAEIME